MIYLYGNGTQTCKLSHKANTLNYILHHFSQTSQMLGLKNVTGDLSDYMSAFKLEGHHFTACCVEEDTEVRRWEDPEWKKAEQELIDTGHTWLVTMPGCDDHCGYTRFKTLEEAKEWYVSDVSIDYDDERYWKVN